MRIEIKNVTNDEVMYNSVIEIKSEQEMDKYVDNITTILTIGKLELVESGLPFEEVRENGFYGLISDSFQFIACTNYFEFTIGDMTTQITFIPESMSEAA